MKKAFVTGATGFVGNAVTRALLKNHREVRVLARKNSNLKLLQGLKVELCYGDLRDPESLKRGISDCDEIYHVAAQYTFYNPKPEEIYSSNVQGTQNILQAALDKRIPKVVYTSTVGAIGIPGDGSPGHEETPISLMDCQGHYKRSKFLAEQEALSFYRKGLPVVIVNPSAPVGVADAKPTPTGKMIVDFLNGKMPAYLDTGLNLIDVDDCAMGHLLAAEKGRPGQRYILGNQNLTLKEILRELSFLTGLKMPRVKIPHGFAMTMAHLSETWSRWSRKPPMIEKEAVLLAKKRMFFSSEKAVQELGLPQPDVRIALKKAVEWYLEHGYVREKLKRRILNHHPNLSPIGPAPLMETDA